MHMPMCTCVRTRAHTHTHTHTEAIHETSHLALGPGREKEMIEMMWRNRDHTPVWEASLLPGLFLPSAL